MSCDRTSPPTEGAISKKSDSQNAIGQSAVGQSAVDPACNVDQMRAGASKTSPAGVAYISPVRLMSLVVVLEGASVILWAVLAKLGYVDLYLADSKPWMPFLAVGAGLGLIVIAFFRLAGLADQHYLYRASAPVGKVGLSLVAAFLLLIATLYLLKSAEEFSRVWMGLVFIVSLGSSILLRLALPSLASWLNRLGILRRRVAIYGNRLLANEVDRHVREHAGFIETVGVFATDIKTRSEKLEELVERGKLDPFDQVIVALPKTEEKHLCDAVSKLSVLPCDMQICSEIPKSPCKIYGVEHIGNLNLLVVQRRPMSDIEVIAKRLFDVIFGAVGVLVLLPFLPLIAFLIKRESIGPVFFVQRRHGFNHKIIRVWKFRSMSVTEDGNEIRQAQRADTRITKVGAVMRRLSIDELPQLINVLKGEMSLVGPRPHALAHNREFSPIVENYANRHRVKPGITGWAQVHGYRGNTEITELMRQRVQFDLDYIENWSLWLDFKIIMRTVQMIFSGDLIEDMSAQKPSASNVKRAYQDDCASPSSMLEPRLNANTNSNSNEPASLNSSHTFSETAPRLSVVAALAESGAQAGGAQAGGAQAGGGQVAAVDYSMAMQQSHVLKSQPSLEGHPALQVVDGKDIPLCIDLDGSLIRTDILIETALLLIKRNPLYAFFLPFWAWQGRAVLKSKIAELIDINPQTLPYNDDVLAVISNAKKAGSEVWLVTASDKKYADDIADYLGIFDGVLASSESVNLAGEVKAERLNAKFGRQQFDYVGDSHADFAVWRQARRALLVNPSRRAETMARLLPRDYEIISRRGSRSGAFIRAVRPQHWLKNALVFVPLVLAHQVNDPHLVAQGILAFIVFCLAASSVYVFNDLLDLEQDRQHPKKCERPFAAGRIPVTQGLVFAPVLAILALAIASFLPVGFMIAILVYLASNLIYSLYLKKIMLADVLALSGMFTLRIIAGGLAVGIAVSYWLLTFSLFLFFSLALVKRFSELRNKIQRVAKNQKNTLSGRGYQAEDADGLAIFGITSAQISVLVLALYIHSDAVRKLYATPDLIWLVCPLLLYLLGRIWFLARRDEMPEDPVLFAVKDRQSQILGIVGLMILWMAAG